MELILLLAILGIAGAFFLGLHIGCRLSVQKNTDEKRTYVDKVRNSMEEYKREQSFVRSHERLLDDFVVWVNVKLYDEPNTRN